MEAAAESGATILDWHSNQQAPKPKCDSQLVQVSIPLPLLLISAHIFSEQTGLSDQAELPERPLIVYKAGLDGGRDGGKLIKSVSGGCRCLGLAWRDVKITIITFITQTDCLELVVRWGLEAPN